MREIMEAYYGFQVISNGQASWHLIVPVLYKINWHEKHEKCQKCVNIVSGDNQQKFRRKHSKIIPF